MPTVKNQMGLKDNKKQRPTAQPSLLLCPAPEKQPTQQQRFSTLYSRFHFLYIFPLE